MAMSFLYGFLGFCIDIKVSNRVTRAIRVKKRKNPNRACRFSKPVTNGTQPI
jgi:hypothetical protein